jgi:HAD superfamily hydrolase (TIGR01509 family)
MQDRPVLLFDVMDTLVYNPYNREIPAFFGLSAAELLQQKDPTVWPLFELGHIDEADYLTRYFRDRRRFDHAAFQQVVANAYRWMDGAETLLGRLRQAGLEIHALSNYPIWYRTIETRLQLSRYLNWTFVSCMTGVRKPAPEAYQRAARWLTRPSADCIFVDDNRENCEAARSIGMTAIHYVNAADVTRQLERLGLFEAPPHS